MSLHEVIETKQREADLQKSAWPRLVSSGLFMVSLLVFLAVITNAPGDRSRSHDAYSLILIVTSGLWLAYHHYKNLRRIEVLELELLKLKRRLPESDN